MLLTTAIWAVWLFSASILAQVSFTNNEYYIYAGQPFTITWTNARGPVTVTVMTGPDENLQPVLVIVSGYAGSEYTWTPPPTLAAGSYELEVNDGGSADYSPRFNYPAPPQPSSSVVQGGNVTSGNPVPIPTTNPQPTSRPTSPPTASTTPNPSDSSSQTLSTPAKIAIATLGALLVVTVLALLGYCLLTRRRRRRTAAAAVLQHEHQPNTINSGGAGAISTTFSHELPLSTLGGAGSSSFGGSPRSTAAGTVYGVNNKHGIVGVGSGGVVDAYGHGNPYGRAELPVRGWSGDVVELPSGNMAVEEGAGFAERDSYEEDGEEEGEGGGEGEQGQEREEWRRTRGEGEIGIAQ